MFKLNEKDEVDRRILKRDYIRYSPVEVSTRSTPKSQIYINLPREDYIFILLNSYIDLFFEVVKRTNNSRFATGNDIRLVNLGPIVLFNNFKLTTSSGRDLADVSHTQNVSFIYKLLTSSTGSDDLSIGFHRDRGSRRDEITNKKNIKSKYHVRILLKNVF